MRGSTSVTAKIVSWAVLALGVGAVTANGEGLARHTASPFPATGSILQLAPPAGDLEFQPPVITALAIQPGGSLLAAAGDDHLVRIWDLTRGEVVHTLSGHTDWVRAAVFSTDGQQLLTAGMDGRILQWDVTRGARIRELFRQEHPFTSLDLDGPSERLLAVGFRCPLHILELKNGRIVQALECPCMDMRDVAVSLDGRLAAASGRNGKIRVWYLGDGSIVRELEGHERPVRALCFARDGRTLISAGDDRTLRMWDTRTGALASSQTTGRTKIMRLIATEEGQVAGGGSDNSIRVWEIASGDELAHFTGHTGTVSALASDGTRLVSAGFDTTIRVWELPPTSRWSREAMRGAEATRR